jgi:two-component system OmpR family response regulator
MDARVSIVVAEDDPSICDLIRTRLELDGYDVHTAHDGPEALERIFAVQPRGVVLDINMPGLDGFGVLEALRATDDFIIPPVLFLTARHLAGDISRALSLGAKDYLTKPFTEADLTARVARLLRPSLAWGQPADAGSGTA